MVCGAETASTHDNKAEDCQQGPGQELYIESPSLQLVCVLEASDTLTKNQREDDKDKHEEQLEPNAPHVYVFACLGLRSVVLVCDHGPSGRLDDEGYHVREDKSFGKPAGRDSKDFSLGEKEVDEACDGHVSEGIDPWAKLVSPQRLCLSETQMCSLAQLT
jgi:hypothetical protein